MSSEIHDWKKTLQNSNRSMQVYEYMTYLPTCMVDFDGKFVGKYSIHQYTIYRSYGNVNGSYPPGFLRMVVLPALSRPVPRYAPEL